MSVKRKYTTIQSSSLRNFLLASVAQDLALLTHCVSVVLTIFSYLFCTAKDRDKYFSTSLKPWDSPHWRALV